MDIIHRNSKSPVNNWMCRSFGIPTTMNCEYFVDWSITLNRYDRGGPSLKRISSSVRMTWGTRGRWCDWNASLLEIICHFATHCRFPANVPDPWRYEQHILWRKSNVELAVSCKLSANAICRPPRQQDMNKLMEERARERAANSKNEFLTIFRKHWLHIFRNLLWSRRFEAEAELWG